MSMLQKCSPLCTSPLLPRHCWFPNSAQEYISTLGSHSTRQKLLLLESLWIFWTRLDPEIGKLQWHRALQTTKQGTLPIRMFHIKFATLANDIPFTCRLSDCPILAIFMKNIKSQLHQLVKSTLTKYNDWELAYATAMKHKN
ncbi:hypothetical protein J3Q64DRAFT_1830198 [Phycomyces blakesleeanus]|uniref:Uncharacterized protein n=1 Tax=Phycomyces blakesleeanus TaxID=4837 RepID=A0ABR3B9A2_PHYBL